MGRGEIPSEILQHHPSLSRNTCDTNLRRITARAGASDRFGFQEPVLIEKDDVPAALYGILNGVNRLPRSLPQKLLNQNGINPVLKLHGHFSIIDLQMQFQQGRIRGGSRFCGAM